MNSKLDRSVLDIRNWEKIAPDYIKFINRQKSHFKELIYGPLLTSILKSVKNVKRKKMLDAGCGEGHLARILAFRGARVEGCDASRIMIDEAVRLNQTLNNKVKYFRQDLTKKFPEQKKFDVVVSNLVIFDIYDYAKVFRNIHEILSDYGRFVFTVLHPCFNMTENQRYNLRHIGYNGGTITFKIQKSYKDESFYERNRFSNYFISGGINHYHRPIESYINALSKCNFLVENIFEPTLKLDEIHDETTYYRHYLPKFMVINAVKIPKKLNKLRTNQ